MIIIISDKDFRTKNMTWHEVILNDKRVNEGLHNDTGH